MFGDFQCPFCLGAQSVLRRVRERLGDRLLFGFRHLPIPERHPLAPLAAEASEAAAAQGRFWEYHDALYANQPKLSRETILEVARRPRSRRRARSPPRSTSGAHRDRIARDLASAAGERRHRHPDLLRQRQALLRRLRRRLAGRGAGSLNRVAERAYTARRLTSQREFIRWDRTRAALLALVACLGLGALAPALATAATGSITGTVTDASSGEPIEGAEVCAGPFDTEEGVEACAHTETDGTYFIGGLDPASYRVWFWGGSQYVFEYFDGKRSWEDADPVEVPSGGKAAGIDADLDRTAAINGTVHASEDGLGVEAIDVCAYPLDLAEESFGRCAETAGDGTYSIGGLSPGDYKVEFWPGFSGRKLAYQFCGPREPLSAGGHPHADRR